MSKFRTAWIIKKTPTAYCYGDWKNITYLNELKNWVSKQNKKYSDSYYWIEYKTEKNKIKNFINDEIVEYVLLEK
tara:strand:- start:471 stop:695 length:225 start_codon:yes stop_codon:yes gene_type:complete